MQLKQIMSSIQHAVYQISSVLLDYDAQTDLELSIYFPQFQNQKGKRNLIYSMLYTTTPTISTQSINLFVLKHGLLYPKVASNVQWNGFSSLHLPSSGIAGIHHRY